MNEPVLKVENVSKKFCRSLKRSLWYGVKDLVSEMTFSNKERTKLRRHEFWALKDVFFELHKGETFGLIGANGAGKSTLLKLINGLIKFDTGCISIHGRVGALIQLGVGFNPVLTGRENIYVNAAVLGLGRKEVDHRLDEIVDFAEIGDFIDAPVQSYSAGMKVRLGFSVAANLNPDLLLIDEVLSVGDSSFRQRCLDRLTEYKKNGGTIIFVSHNTVAVEAISDRVMLLDHGRVIDTGDPAGVIEKYEQRMLELSRQADLRLQPEKVTDDDVLIKDIKCYGLDGNHREGFEFRESFEIRLHYETSKTINNPLFTIAIRKKSRSDPIVCMMSMLYDDVHIKKMPHQGVVACLIKDPMLSPGIYHLQVGVLARVSGSFGKKWYKRPHHIGTFTVLLTKLKNELPGVPAAHSVGALPPVILNHTWKLKNAPKKGVNQ